MLEKTKLVQRLLPPIDKNGFDGFDFASGGIGGFKREAYDMLNTAFAFDYMGNALFDFGRLPKAFQKMIDGLESDPLQAATQTMTFDPEPWQIELQGLEAKEALLYVLAGAEKLPRAEALIRDQNKPYRDREFRMEESLLMKEEILGETGRGVQGWFELDNGFFVFSNYRMFDKTAQLFGVAHGVKAPQPK